MPSNPSVEVPAQTSDTFQFGYVTIAQTKDLERLHPAVVQAIETGTRHAPTHLHSLESCPDRYPDFPCFFYVTSEGRIVASLRAFPDRLSAEDRFYPWAWCCDLFTDPEQRGKGLALKVVRESVPVLHGRNIAWGGLFASPVTNHICLRLGFALPGFGPRFMLMKSIRPFAAYAMRSPGLGKAGDALYRVAFAGFLRPWLRRRVGSEGRFRMRRVDNPEELLQGPPFEQVYDAMFHFTDSVEKLIWKLRAGHNTSLHLIFDANTDRPLGYLVFKQRPSSETFFQQFGQFDLLTLMDFGIFGSPENYEVVLHATIRHFMDSSADMLEIISSSRTLNRLAARHGFLRVGKGTPLIFHFPPAWSLGNAPFDPMNWRLTHYSSDGFAFR